MSEEQRITKVAKEKDPRRVEAGKRLGAISKAAKEKKAARQRMEQITEEPEPTEDACGEGYSMITVLTGVGVLSGLVCLYFTYKQDKRATVTESPVGTQSDDNRIPQKQPTPSSGNKLRSLDD